MGMESETNALTLFELQLFPVVAEDLINMPSLWRANPTQYLGQAYYSHGKENWGWSWKERWIAARPWEIRVHSEPHNLKKAHSKQESKSTLPTKPALSNGKVTAKSKMLPQAAPVDSSTAGSSQLLIPS
uniref:Uncharacterized protein n=1 Tax=Populus alba TaxID=43335 RepID=A0A4U5N6Y6_POPAL|nr:hypothetical protein D5086_0000283040 [Populus alba]